MLSSPIGPPADTSVLLKRRTHSVVIRGGSGVVQQTGWQHRVGRVGLERAGDEADGHRLAAAVLIDATIIRGVLLPATMKLLGDWNWWLPSKLRWLPKVTHEPEMKPVRA